MFKFTQVHLPNKCGKSFYRLSRNFNQGAVICNFGPF